MHHVNVSKVKNTKIQINEDGKEGQKKYSYIQINIQQIHEV